MVDRVPMRDMARQIPSGALTTPPRTFDTPVRVRAWIVDGHGRDVEIDGEAIAWTPRAAHVHYFDANGREGFVWVWASAVTRT
jgi:hypothetical protein